MTHDFCAMIWRATLAMSAATALVLILRHVVRHWFGARVTYLLWGLVPAAALGVLVPAPTLPTAVALPSIFTVASYATPAAPLSTALEVSPWLFAAWLLGACAFAAILVRRQHRFLHGLGSLRLTHYGWCAETAVCGPALVGAWRPRLILPADFASRYTAIERRLILAHERAHLARGDAQTNALVAALRCLQWFNPLVHFAASRFRFDQELACDARVMTRFPRARRSYAGAMLKTQLADFRLPVGCHWQSSHPLKERIAMLKRPLPGRTRSVLGFSVAVALISAVTYSTWAAQPAVISKPLAAAPLRDSKGADLINIDIALRVGDGGVHKMQVRSPDGVPFAVADGDGANRWEVEGTARAREDGTFSIDTVVKHASKIEARPGLIVEAGKSASLQITDASGLALHASFVLNHVVAGAPTKDQPATENLSYRRMYPPEYPQAAFDAHQSGKLVLKVQVDENGNARFAEVEKADPPEARTVFAQASIAAVMQWKYNPAIMNGKPVSGWARVPIDFSLVDDDG